MTWAVRPQVAHWPWLAGSARKHLLQTGPPAAVRLATWAGWRQRLQASSRARSQQRRQQRAGPSRWLSGTVWPQDGQAGATTPAAPAASSAWIRALTRGEPCAPWPVSSPGHWSSSRSTWWRWNGRGTAAAITSSSRG